MPQQFFEGTRVSITQKGKRHLGTALGTNSFIDSYVRKNVPEWVCMIEQQSFAVTQPHGAYAAFTHGLTSRRTFLVRTTPNIGNLLQPLEEAIRHTFLPSLLGQSALIVAECDLLALPACLCGLNVIHPTRVSDFYHTSSKYVSVSLVSLILDQSTAYPTNCKESTEEINQLPAT